MTSHPEFGFSTTATEAGVAFSDEITGKNIVITGVSPNSLGAALAHSLAPHSPRHLILASRTLSNLSAVCSSLLSLYPELRLSLVLIELASQKSVRKAAAQIKDILREDGGLDVLFNNAGVNVKERGETEEGIELQFGINHVGGFLLANCLMELLIKGGGRVVMTSSEGHRISPVRLSDWNLEAGGKIPVDEEPRRGLPEGILRGKGGYEPSVAYGQSKTANILFAVAINETLKGRVRGLAVHPGDIMTDLVRDLDQEALDSLNKIEKWKTADQGAATLVIAGFDPSLSSVEKGVYLSDCQIKRSSKWALDVEKAEKLWKLSEGLVGEKFTYGKKSRL